MSLSFRTTSMSVCDTPALFSASKAMPALIAPSPMIATAFRVLALQPGGDGHAERGRDRGRRMGGAEGVVLALVAAREAGDAAELAQRAHALAPAGQDLVRIGLVADVPDDPVARRVEHVVQRDRQLDRAEVGRQVAAGLGDALQHELAQLRGQQLEFGAREPAQVGRAVDGFEELVRHDGSVLAIDHPVGQDGRLCTSARPLRRERGAAPARRSSSARRRAGSRPSTLT